jgi:outer membrane immunogenic protein
MVRVGIRMIAAVGIAAGFSLHAEAADMRAPVVKAPAPAYYDWTGFYIGAHGGGGFGTKDWLLQTVAPGLNEGSHDVSGWLAGGQIGFNWQFGSWVWGIEAQVSAADLQGERVSASNGTRNLTAKVDQLGTVAGRLGHTWDRFMLYGKFGMGWAHDKYSITNIPTGVTFADFSDRRWGWMGGVGVEYVFLGNWSAKLEYNYMHFTDKLINSFCSPANFCGATGAFSEQIGQELHVIKAGINYRFGGGPVIAKY